MRKRIVSMVTSVATVAVTASAAFLPLAAGAAGTYMTPAVLLEFGSSGTGDGQFGFLAIDGIATDFTGSFVYVMDSGNNRVQKFDGSGNFLAKWGSFGSADGQFFFPAGIAVDPAGNVYVADLGNNRIQKFDSNGNFLLKWAATAPHGIEADSQGNVWVGVNPGAFGPTDLVKYDGSGNVLVTIPAVPGSIRGTAVDSNDNLYARVLNGAVLKYDSNGTSLGTFIPSGVVSQNTSLDFDVHDNAYLSTFDFSANSQKIRVYDSAGVQQLEFGSAGTGPGQFGDGAIYIALDSSGNIFASDSLNRRVQKFGPAFTPAPDVSECAQEALDALGLEAGDVGQDVLDAIESSCDNLQVEVIAPESTENGSVKLEAGDTLVVGFDSTLNGTTQTTVDGDGSGTLILGAGVHVNGSVKNIGTVVIAGSDVSISGSLTGIGTLIFLPGASLTVGGSLQADVTIQL